MGPPRKQHIRSTVTPLTNDALFAAGFRPFTTPTSKGKETPRMSKEIADRDAKDFARFMESNSRDGGSSSPCVTPLKRKQEMFYSSPSPSALSKKPLQPIP